MKFLFHEKVLLALLSQLLIQVSNFFSEIQVLFLQNLIFLFKRLFGNFLSLGYFLRWGFHQQILVFLLQSLNLCVIITHETIWMLFCCCLRCNVLLEVRSFRRILLPIFDTFIFVSHKRILIKEGSFFRAYRLRTESQNVWRMCGANHTCCL